MRTATAVALVLLCTTTAALASPESEALKQQGRQSLANAQFMEASERFAAAVKADARDTEAAFLLGVAANRAGQFSVSGPALRQAQSGGYRNPDLEFELGWAALGAGQARACIAHLERFEAEAPGRGQTSEFLGRCHLALKEYDRAEARFKQALERDARLAPTVNLSLASLAQARGKPDAARAHLESASSADAPTGRALRELAGPPDEAIQPDKPLRLSMSFAVGHNDNVIGLGNTIPLPTDISRKGADYARLALGGSYTRQLTARSSATAGYALLLDRYDGLSSSNLNDHYLYLDLFHQATERVGLSLRTSAEYTELGGSSFRDLWALRPAISYRFSANAVTELSYNYSDSDYKFPTAPVFNRDGTAHGLALMHSFRLSGTRWGGAVGLSYNRNNAQGSDFQFDSLGASAAVRYTFANRIVAAFSVSGTSDDYRNLNSLAGTGFSFARADRQQVASVQFTGPLSDKLRWFVQAQALRNKSNIAFYEYKQNVATGGIAVDF